MLFKFPLEKRVINGLQKNMENVRFSGEIEDWDQQRI